MAATWPVLLLLLSVFNPLLSIHLHGQNATGNGSLDQPTTHPPTALTEDEHDYTFDDSAATTQDPEPSTSGPSSTTNDTDGALVPRMNSGGRLPITEAAEITQRTETNGHVATTIAADDSTASIQDPEPSSSGPSSTTNDTDGALVPRMNSGGRLPITEAAEITPRSETNGHVATTNAADDSTASTKDPDAFTSGPSSTTSDTGGALVPHTNSGGKLPVPELAEITTPTTAGDQVLSGDNRFPCATGPSRRDGLVSQCLIAIATLAGVATIFIVSTTVLCTKLSANKYRYRMQRQGYGTEMVCISALLPDGDGIHGRPRIPKSNGALIPNGEDDDGDDLTLQSFIPETDRGSERASGNTP